ncbi:hypothetical protein PsYK624_118380 [Phanerochaete sordida]|uniref:Uncharacterized protein n=1 Tax=Phanerochaete sordida TaxID=48140 RepID=A0A9P3LIY1_9APHY|nr:hypothetical protein PsYK624_118380 [Phanerochaete sordida]
MVDLRPALPPEIVYTIVSRAIARHLDDVLVGPLSLLAVPSNQKCDNETGDLVNSLLAVSYQIRRTTLNVLATFLGIKLSCYGIWRLQAPPCSVLKPVRGYLIQRLDLRADDRVLKALLCNTEHSEPPALAVYTYTHALEEICARPFDSVAVTDPDGISAPVVIPFNYISQLFRLHVLKNYAECPEALQEVLFERMEGALARSDAEMFYGTVLPPIEEMWGRISAVAHRVTDDALSLAVTAFDEVIGNLVRVLRKIRRGEDEVLRGWPHSVSVDAAIGAKRLDAWCALFNEMADLECVCDSAEELREVAQDLADSFHARLESLEAAEGRRSVRRAAGTEAEVGVA